MAVEDYDGPLPLLGDTYIGTGIGDFGVATNRFIHSGMPYMKFGENYYFNSDYRPVPEDKLDKLVKAAAPIKSDGGPSTYYDFLPDWVTLNDAMEYLAEHRWGKYALHLKDSMKACFRFGSKDGADVAYDAKKLVYSGLRLLVMIQGKAAVHAFLMQLANDPQFQVKD